MLEWLAYQVPWWAWIIVAALAVGLIHRVFGFRNAVVAAAIAAAAIFHARARQQGWQEREAKTTRDRLKAIEERKKSDAEIDQMGGADRDREWARWLRDGR